MSLSPAEIFLSLIIVMVGIVNGIRLYFNKAEKKKQINCGVNAFGSAIIVIICGLFTPPDILSNIIFSIPLMIIYSVILYKNRAKQSQ